MPRHLGALCHLIDPQARAIENASERQPALAHHLGQCLGVSSVRALPFGRHRPRRSVERDQQARLGFDQCQATRKRRAGFDEWI